MANRNLMPAPMSLEEYALQRVRDWDDGPMHLSALGKLPEIGPARAAEAPRPFDPRAVSEAVTVQAVRPRPRMNAKSATGSDAHIAEGLEDATSHTGRMIEGQHFGTTGLLQVAKGENPYRALRAIKRIAPIFRGANAGFTLAGEAAGVVGDLQKGVPLTTVVPGAALHVGGNAAAAAAVGGLLGLVGGPAGAVGGAMLGGLLADRYLPSREALGRQFWKAADAYGRNPHYGMP
jgi:hypothetical protein